MTDKIIKLNCPQCKGAVLWTDEFPYRPFCSKRCQLIDFGAWANEEHTISGDSVMDSASSDDENGFS